MKPKKTKAGKGQIRRGEWLGSEKCARVHVAMTYELGSPSFGSAC
jgi:hypothetical protein